MTDDVMPMTLWALLATVADDAKPREARLRALKIVERTAGKHRREAARELVPVLHAAPDVAGPVHLALLVLDADLAIGRREDGMFVASEQPLSACVDDGVARGSADVGRVSGLDALARLFGPDESPPLFLSPPDRPAPAPYRPPPEALEVKRIEAAHATQRALHKEKLRALGLDDDDLDDDIPPPRAVLIPRRAAATFGVVDEGATFEIASRGVVLEVGRAHAGAWWSDDRVGDHRGARRFHVRLERDEPPRAIVRRERALDIRDAVVDISLGELRLKKTIRGRGVVVFVEEEDGLVVGVMLSWSAWDPRPPVENPKRPAARTPAR